MFVHHDTQPTTWQVGPGGRDWLPTVKGEPTSTIKYLQTSIFCQSIQSPTQIFSWNWCVLKFRRLIMMVIGISVVIIFIGYIILTAPFLDKLLPGCLVACQNTPLQVL